MRNGFVCIFSDLKSKPVFLLILSDGSFEKLTSAVSNMFHACVVGKLRFVAERKASSVHSKVVEQISEPWNLKCWNVEVK